MSATRPMQQSGRRLAAGVALSVILLAALGAAVAPGPAPAIPQPQAGKVPAASAPVRVDLPFDRYCRSSELDMRAQQLNDVHLVYPKTAYEMRLKGRVVLSILINETGAIDAVSVLESEPAGVFDDPALTAVAALRFSAASRNGRAVKSQKKIEVLFDPYESINTP